MSKKRYESCCCQPYGYQSCGIGCGSQTGSGIGLPALVILILILLQFNRKGERCKVDYVKDCDDDYNDHDHCDVEYDDYDKDCDDDYVKDNRCEHKKGYDQVVDNGILFIIALFYLSCCSKRFC
jgi:hypothetical protein